MNSKYKTLYVAKKTLKEFEKIKGILTYENNNMIEYYPHHVDE